MTELHITSEVTVYYWATGQSWINMGRLTFPSPTDIRAVKDGSCATHRESMFNRIAAQFGIGRFRLSGSTEHGPAWSQTIVIGVDGVCGEGPMVLAESRVYRPDKRQDPDPKEDPPLPTRPGWDLIPRDTRLSEGRTLPYKSSPHTYVRFDGLVIHRLYTVWLAWHPVQGRVEPQIGLVDWLGHEAVMKWLDENVPPVVVDEDEIRARRRREAIEELRARS